MGRNWLKQITDDAERRNTKLEGDKNGVSEGTVWGPISVNIFINQLGTKRIRTC